MDNTRQQKIARQIQRDVAEILQKDAADLVRGSLVTVTAVRISPDLAYSKIYMSASFPSTERIRCSPLWATRHG